MRQVSQEASSVRSVGGGLASSLGSLLTAFLSLSYPLCVSPFLMGLASLLTPPSSSCPSLPSWQASYQAHGMISSVSICRRNEGMDRWPEFPHWSVMLESRADTCRVLWIGILPWDQAQQGDRASSEEFSNLFYPL